MDKDTILNALRQVCYPGYTRDIVSFGLVKTVEPLPGGGVLVGISVATNDAALPERLRGEVAAALAPLTGGPFEVRISRTVPPATTPPARQSAGAENAATSSASGATGTGAGALPKPERIPGARRVIAVASGKGGVGKSTVSVNLACALVALHGAGRAGLLDCDMCGPSIPIMTGLLGQRPEADADGVTILPLENHGLKIMSLGFLMDEDAPVIWRGPMIMKAVRQFTMQVAWGGVETLVVDLPPGTGDAPLSLAQTVALDGVLIVTTPQPAAAGVARRGAELFRRLGVPILGVVENMSGPGAAADARDGGNDDGGVADNNGGAAAAASVSIFGSGGGATVAEQLGVPLLAQIPLDARVREGGDDGVPVVLAEPESAPARAFRELAARIASAD